MKNRFAALTALSLAGGAACIALPAHAQQQDTAQAKQQQQQQTEGQGVRQPAADQAGQQQQSQGQPAEQQDQAQTGQQQAGQQLQDTLVATVDDVEVRQSDVMDAISALPPRIQQTPPQMLIPAVIDQLVLRTLILEQARAENLQEDPEVIRLVESGTAAAEDQALVQVWVQRELDERVTATDVEKAFAELKATDPEMTQTLDEARPQVEQALQRQAMAEVSTELRDAADVIYYGPAGEPLDIQPPGQTENQGQTGEQGQTGGQGQGSGQGQQ